jgi:hypothetical protein
LLLAGDLDGSSSVEREISTARENGVEILPVATEKAELPKFIESLKCFHVYERSGGVDSGLRKFLMNREHEGGREASVMAILIAGALDLLYNRP